jgi:hypothetical protein
MITVAFLPRQGSKKTVDKRIINPWRLEDERLSCRNDQECCCCRPWFVRKNKPDVSTFILYMIHDKTDKSGQGEYGHGL